MGKRGRDRQVQGGGTEGGREREEGGRGDRVGGKRRQKREVRKGREGRGEREGRGRGRVWLEGSRSGLCKPST